MNEEIKISTMPDNRGVGFTSYQPLTDMYGYREEKTGRYYNYHVTQEAWEWPVTTRCTEKYVIDAFSPNVNKDLHVGHLRNLALAVSLKGMFPVSSFVAMFGYSMGVKPGALTKLEQWFDFTGYHPKVYIDILMLLPDEQLKPGIGEYEGGLVWQGPDGPVLMVRSENHPTKPGRNTYAYHDLAFNTQFEPPPTHIITGTEQKSHFAELGMKDKHIPMGLVLDPVTGQKMKSRSLSFGCEVLLAEEAIQMVVDKLRESNNTKELAWNVLAWNFLSVGRKKNVKFNVDEWTKPDSPGLYISYTAARILKALTLAADKDVNVYNVDLTDDDVKLLGRAEYINYWHQLAKDKMDPSYLASYAHYLAKHLNRVYESGEKLVGGRPGLIATVQYAYSTLSDCMAMLGMFLLESV